MSLSVLNERSTDEYFVAHGARLKRLALAVSAAKLGCGQDVVKPLYDALGVRIHHGKERDVDRLIQAAYDEVGVPASVLTTIDAPETERALRDSHADGIGRVGEDVGTPIISVNGHAFFGPVISPAPTGQAALDLWDGIVLATRYEGFFELKRSRTVGPIFSQTPGGAQPDHS